jgi:hypothetical protein
MRALFVNLLFLSDARRRNGNNKDNSKTEESGLENLVSKEISQVNSYESGKAHPLILVRLARAARVCRNTQRIQNMPQYHWLGSVLPNNVAA